MIEKFINPATSNGKLLRRFTISITGWNEKGLRWLKSSTGKRRNITSPAIRKSDVAPATQSSVSRQPNIVDAQLNGDMASTPPMLPLKPMKPKIMANEAGEKRIFTSRNRLRKRQLAPSDVNTRPR